MQTCDNPVKTGFSICIHTFPITPISTLPHITPSAQPWRCLESSLPALDPYFISPRSRHNASMLLSYVASASLEKKHPGTPSSLSRWCATHSQHFPCLGQSNVHGHGLWLLHSAIRFFLLLWNLLLSTTKFCAYVLTAPIFVVCKPKIPLQKSYASPEGINYSGGYISNPMTTLYQICNRKCPSWDKCI